MQLLRLSFIIYAFTFLVSLADVRPVQNLCAQYLQELKDLNLEQRIIKDKIVRITSAGFNRTSCHYDPQEVIKICSQSRPDQTKLSDIEYKIFELERKISANCPKR